ncbi:hypothetical protein [Peterkaempfera griseoplana]|uniref:hypothetical protein n=1 Tax=Peterkaempfera griseoplana TaxID=66896 RepID=UPI0006E34E04|nr:hypothetical protein [Peterkaempfera griseoplana]
MDTWATWTTQGIIAGAGGATTVEVGVITGDLTVHTMWADEEARVTVQYTGASDWYTLQGSPVPAPDEATGRAIHQQAVRAVQAGGGAVVGPLD